MQLDLIKKSFNNTPSAWLLYVQLSILVASPLFNSNIKYHALSWMLSALVLTLIGKVIQRSPLYTSVGVVLIALSLTLSAGVAFGGWHKLAPIANVIEATTYFYGAAGLLIYMFKDSYLTRDELYAAAAAFTLFSWGFAFIYSACQSWYPDSFNVASSTQPLRTWIELLFLSFSVQSGTGLSDIVPLAPQARVLVALQMFVAVMYLALVVSRLVSLTPLARSKDD